MYNKVLEALGIPYNIIYHWIIVGRTSRIQGWKLHLSTILTEAEQLIRVTVPLLFERDIYFKITKDDKILTLLNEGLLGSTQIGKFMTIYPANDYQANEIALIYADITRGFHGPVIITDLRLGDIVYSRYGSFNPIIKFDRLPYNK